MIRLANCGREALSLITESTPGNSEDGKDDTHDTHSGDESGCKQYTAVCTLFFLFVASFDLLHNEADKRRLP